MTTETEQLDLFGQVVQPPKAKPTIEELKAKAKEAKKVNPCITMFGPGPDGSTCKTCVHLRGLQYSKTYWKCELRRNTHGAGSDHRVNWPGCGKYEQGEHEDKIVYGR